MPFFLLIAAAAGLFMLSSKKTQPANTSAPASLPPPPVSSPGILQSTKPIVIPANITKAISDAIASLDPEVIKNLANQLDQQGYHQQAADMREFSKGMMNAMNKA